MANEGTIIAAVGTRVAQTITGDVSLERDASAEVFWKKPSSTSLMQVLMGPKPSRVIPAKARYIEWWEEDLDPTFVTPSAINAGAGTFTLSASDVVLIFAGKSLGVAPGTTAHVTAVSGTTITVDSTAGMVNGVPVMVGASVVSEYSSEPSPLVRQPGHLSNNMFTSRDTTALSGWVLSDLYYGGKPQEVRQREALKFQHKLNLEREAFIGQQPGSQLTLGGQNVLYTNGIFAQQVTNVATLSGGVLTWPLLTQFAQSVDRLMTTNTPYLFVSRSIRGLLDTIAYNKWVPNEKEDEESDWGLQVRSLMLGDKRYKVLTEDCLAGTQFGTTMCAVDIDQLTAHSPEYKVSGKGPASGMRWMIEYARAIQITGIDGLSISFLSDMAIKLLNEGGTWRLGNVLSA